MAVVVAALMLRWNLTEKEAYNIVKKRRPSVRPLREMFVAVQLFQLQRMRLASRWTSLLAALTDEDEVLCGTDGEDTADAHTGSTPNGNGPSENAQPGSGCHVQ